jgi:Flp pilus assembly protein TadG
MSIILSDLRSSNDGAVAPLVALMLFALTATAGIAFDYARMASMDTELQGAADQAALAAASQLDGEDGACARAAAAANALVSNETLLANDGDDTAVVVDSEGGCDASGKIRFYQNKEKTQGATSDSNANFVEVFVNPREAFYAFTPVVGLISSGQMAAAAFAGVGEAICRVPPVMMCNPREGADPDFTAANYVGKGIRLVANDGGGNYAPGNFGFLDVGLGNGAGTLREVLGRNGHNGNCVQSTGVTTEPGNMIAVRDALNTRFDIYDNGLNQACGGNGALCPPSANSRKDLMRRGSGSNACGFATGTGGNGWRVSPNAYPPAALTTNRTLNTTEIGTTAPMGYPRDICHSLSVTGACSNGRIGDGVWDRNAYYRTNSASYAGGTPPAALGSSPTRYEVYKYEMANAATYLRQQSMGGLTSHGSPVCSPPGITPSTTQIDRRVLSAAVINCASQGLNGRETNVQVARWIDLFLVEPSVPRPRTENADIYVEVIGETSNRTDGNAIQTIKKSVPYLIE